MASAGALSVYNNLFFRSGSIMLGETGWWRLLHAFSPPVAAHIILEMARDKPKGRPRNQMALDKTLFIARVTEMGYAYLINHEVELPLALASGAALDGSAAKKRRGDSDDLSAVSSISYCDQFDSDSKTELVEENTLEDAVCPMPLGDSTMCSDVVSLFRGFEFTPAGYVPPSDSSSIHSFQQSALYYDSDSGSGSPNYQPIEHSDDCDVKTEKTEPKTKKPVEEKPIKRDSLFSSELNSVDLPWIEKLPEPRKDIVEISEYEEIQLLKQVEHLIPKVKDANKKAYLCRLKAKLALRRLKRHKHLPIFDLDKAVKMLGGYVTEDPRVAMNPERVLDRFQRSYQIANLCGTITSTSYGTVLLSSLAPLPFRSPHSGAALRPFIRRDAQAQPLWLRLMDELLLKTNRKKDPDYSPPPHATIDYSYVRPQHIAAVNNICAQFFWPGVDLTEALEYPEFSCVVTYKKLVVGFAFLVPDVGRNEAYISFVFTRPEWRNAKIATFMLYHLLQTCTGKDVTLHVSPTNPAIFLYQKFGFKVEELIQDFYEKYFDIEYKGCRHALFLRLVR
ncbi:cysteine-rich protein 2-binding protein [Hyposmocoma kahamanoa]|uniref:cysteine-rich protein 2-binding protein n=1 Tax=Hyposmocoma kahamanoa TaxID=1477025 RepID=UPI000E6D66DE|nr:cysteine-rich protein 2-binding protein [Hyposmocoma kahamanoa]